MERTVPRNPRRAPEPVRIEEAPSGPLSPSLHVFLDPGPEEQAPSSEEVPESLAQFVASFPKIPTGLIFQTASDDQSDEGGAEEDLDQSGELAEEGTPTIRLDEGELPPSEDPAYPRGGYASQARGPVRPPAASGRVMPAVNPRFEKMIRQVDSQRTAGYPPVQDARTGKQASSPRAASSSMRGAARRPAAVSGPVGGATSTARTAASPFPNGPRSNAAVPSVGRNSGPLPNRPTARSGFANPVPSPAFGRTSGNLPERQGSGAYGRNSGNIPAPSFTPSAPAVPSVAGRPSTFAASSSQAPGRGKPLLDPHAIEESTIFDEPPIPISEGMKDADKSHSKGRKFAVVGILVALVVLVGVGFFFGSKGNLVIPEITITTTNPNNASSGGGDAGSSSAGSEEQPVGTDEGASASGAGSVTYKYTAKTPGGVEYTVEESTTFDAEGNCTFTTMRMQFPTESAAKDFTDSLARDLGSKYTLDGLNGANATVTVDNSALGLNREDYENALRYSVDDLVILKK